MNHQQYLDLARREAMCSENEGGHCAGAVLVKNNQIIAQGHDRTIQLNDPIAVAELDCIRSAGRRNDHNELYLYTSRSPDMLVAGVIVQFGIGALIVGENKTTNSAVDFLESKNVPLTFIGNPSS